LAAAVTPIAMFKTATCGGLHERQDKEEAVKFYKDVILVLRSKEFYTVLL
jgi:hypothetical protein